MRGLSGRANSASASVLSADLLDHQQGSGNILQVFAGFVAKVAQVLVAIRAMLFVVRQVMHYLLARQVRRQRRATRALVLFAVVFSPGGGIRTRAVFGLIIVRWVGRGGGRLGFIGGLEEGQLIRRKPFTLPGAIGLEEFLQQVLQIGRASCRERV